MCGKFTAMASWREVVDFSQPLGIARDGPDEEVTYGVARPLPVIVWDRETGRRRVVPMRWGFPHAKDWRRPQPIHARSESIETTKAFAEAFATGQRGIVVFKTFNEGEEATTSTGKPKTIQWTIDPRDGQPRGFAFVWRRFELADLPQPMLACCMVTVPANKLLRDTILKHDPDPRMPAILEDADWATWLGENAATPEQAKAVLRTMEGVNWEIAPERKK
ncbi:MAG TPA: SOS response-associated peptidase family protein [Rhizomicrobium sp.]|jgi:putative SOS response-associated peptidase YedK|nr:SOS response-associated peptidase family protein [Rhizomicrobium sp.]